MLIIDSQLTLKHFFLFFGEQPGIFIFSLSLPSMGEICREQQEIAELEMLCNNSTYYTGLSNVLAQTLHPRHQDEVDLASPVAVLISLSRNS